MVAPGVGAARGGPGAARTLDAARPVARRAARRTRRRSRTCSCRSPGGTLREELNPSRRRGDRGASASLAAAHARPLPRVPPRAGGGVLDLRLPDPARGRTRHRVPEPAGRRRASASWATGAHARLRPALRGRRRSSPSSCSVGQRRSRGTAAAARSRSSPRGRAGATASDGATVEYRFDDTRPEARTARLIVDEALQRGAGRHDPVETDERIVSETRLALHRLRRPRVARHEPHGRRDVGDRLRIVDARRSKLLKRLVATPMRAPLPASLPPVAARFLIVEVT